MRIGGSFVELFSLSSFALRLNCSSRPNWNYPMPASSTPATAPPRFECDPRKSFNSHRKVARLCIFSYFQNVDLQNSVSFNRTVLTPKSRSCDPIPYTNTIPIFFYNMAFIPHAGCGHVTSRNGPGFFVRSFKFLDTVLFYSRGKNLCKPHFAWVIWSILTKKRHPFGISQNSWGHRKL